MGASNTGEQGRETGRTRWKRRYFPGWALRIVLLLLVVAVVSLASLEATQDHAADHLLAVLLTVITGMILLIWFFGFSAYSPGLRRGVLAAAVLGLVGFLAAMEPEFSAEMIPRFRPRWLPKPDQRLATPEVSRTVDLARATPDDFPQFLGPHRDGGVDGVRLARTWGGPLPPLWRQPIGAGWSAFAAVNGYAVTMEQRGPNELVTCYRIDDGQLQWSHALPVRHETAMGGVGPRSTPTIDNGRVYATGATAVLRCLDGATGRELWSTDLVTEFGATPEQEIANIAWGRANSPLIVDQWVVVAAGGPKDHPCALAAYDKATGEPAWRAEGTQVSYSSPTLGVLGGERQIVSVNESSVAGYRIEDGRQLWAFPWPGHSNADANTSQPVFLDGNRLAVSKGYMQGAAVWEIQREGDAYRALEIWANPRVLKTKLTSAVYLNGYLYGLSDGILQCVDAADGKRQWQGKRFYHGQILRVEDLLLVLSESGDLTLVDLTPDKYTELARMEDAVSGKCWNTMCLYGNRLLVRSGSEAACYDLPLQ